MDRGYHDIGGCRSLDRTSLSTDSAAPPPWGTLTDALRNALGAKYRIHEQRRKIEELGPEIYNSTSYYEVRVLAMRDMLSEKGILDLADIERKMKEISER